MYVAAAGGFPKWVLLEPFVFESRLDDGESFPDEALIRASGTTSWGAHFRIAFSLAEPPLISRLYAQLPEPGILTKSREGESLHILATHRHLALLVLDITKSHHSIHNLVIFRADEKPSLEALPPCYEPEIDYYHRDNDLHYLGSPTGNATPRVLEVCYLGLWCGEDKEEEFVVAEMNVYVPGDRTKAFTDLCLLRSSYTDDQLPRRKWRTMRVEIILSTADGDPDQLWWWLTETVIPFRRWLCWIDYHRGMLLCDMSRLRLVPTPTVSFLRFPLDKFPSGTRSATCSFRHRGVSVVDHGRLLKFVNVARHDGLVDGALKPGTGFTITCHTLDVDSMTWKEDYSVTSDDILNLPDSLRCSIPLFPQVNIDRPHVVHFVMLPQFNKMWVGCIDMSTKTVESFSLYMDGIKFQPADRTESEFMMQLCSYPRPFLPCEFPRFCYLSRKRKDME